MNNDKTIKQLADELGVSKQAIRKHIDKLPPTLLVTKKGTTIFLSDEVVTYIKSKVKKKDSTLDKKISSSIDSNFEEVTRNKIGVTGNHESEFFEKQLIAKDKQIEEKDNQIKALHKLLDQQQILTLQANKKIEELELKNDEQTEKEQSESISTQNQEAKEEQTKKSFWAKFFGN